MDEKVFNVKVIYVCNKRPCLKMQGVDLYFVNVVEAFITFK